MSDFERVWEECWTRVARGEATIEDCIRRYPEHAEELRRLFAVVTRLNQGRLVRPNAAYKARARAQMLEQIRARPRVRAEPNDRVRVPAGSISFVFRLGFALAVILFLMLVSGTMLAQAALPGDPLYGLKTGSENVFRAVYPDPLAADLIVMNRRADELTRVVGTPAAEHAAREGYDKVLSDLPRYSDPFSQNKIRQQLTEQKTQLERAGVTVPAIDRTLKNLSAAPAITPLPPGGATGGRTTPAAPAGATGAQTPNPVLTTKPTATHTPTSTRRRTRTPSPTRTLTATLPLTGTLTATLTLTRTLSGTSTPPRTVTGTSSLTATPGPQTTDESSPSTSSTETPTPTWTNTTTTTRAFTSTATPCPSPSSVSSISSADACATPTADCGTTSTELSPCGTPTRMGTVNPLESTTPSPSRTSKRTPAGNSETPNPPESVSP